MGQKAFSSEDSTRAHTLLHPQAMKLSNHPRMEAGASVMSLGSARGPQPRRPLGGGPSPRMRVPSPGQRLGRSGAEPRRAQARRMRSAGACGAMAAKSFASRLGGSRRFLNGFLAGAVVGAAGAGLTALQFLRRRDAEPAWPATQPHGESAGRPPSPGPPPNFARRSAGSPPRPP